MYMFAKHLHLTAVVLSVLLFLVRYTWLMLESPNLQKRWVKITPHIIDTVLLASAAWLCIIIAQYPFVHGWITEKFICVILYIVTAFWTLKRADTRLKKVVGGVGSIAWLLIVAKLAVTKQPLLFG